MMTPIVGPSPLARSDLPVTVGVGDGQAAEYTTDRSRPRSLAV
jgi:hypothetical protein